MKFLKKNQVIIYTIALMLVVAGYLNYTTNQEKSSVETAIQMEANDDIRIADIGDAKLVNSNDVITEKEQEENVIKDESITDNINKEIQEANTVTEDEYFVKSKLERDTMYSQMMETYEKVLNSTNSLETQKQTATQEITKINEIKNCIMICENLIKTKGFENNIIFVNGESVSVIIGAEEILPEQIAQIQNIISREMNAQIENIHIATK